MRLLFVILLFSATSHLLAEDRFSFPFAGKLKIEESVYYWDGGSVSVVL